MKKQKNIIHIKQSNTKEENWNWAERGLYMNEKIGAFEPLWAWEEGEVIKIINERVQHVLIKEIHIRYI